MNNDSLFIDAKMWSRDSNRNIQYSDWQKFGTKVVDQLAGFNPVESELDAFGGNLNIKAKATGFFRTQKINDRWWVIDPLGHGYIVKAMNSLRQGNSPNNKKVFDSLFGTTDQWIHSTTNQLRNMGFNCAGSWSDIESITKMNQSHTNKLPYTTQLNLLSEFVKRKKLDNVKKSYPTLVYIFEEGFKEFCENKCASLIQIKSDSNLLGHFSDNELPFQDDLIKQFSALAAEHHLAYTTLLDWANNNKVDIKNPTKEQKNAFAGFVSTQYFKIVSESIKKYDPNHLYIGSRIHSSVKDNPYVFKAMEPYVDIVSINYYGYWNIAPKHIANWASYTNKPFFITEFYTKAVDANMTNISGAGWLVKTQEDRGNYYQNICMTLLKMNNCVGWHWFKYQDNDPSDLMADPSNNDSNKGIVNNQYIVYKSLAQKMTQLNKNDYFLISYFLKNK